MSLLALIPARGGSKGIPRKNIRELCGKPLIAWSIEAAQKSKYIDRIIISTDDQEIADVARSYGAEVPFMRPHTLAQDNTPGVDPVLHALEQILGYDEVLLLQPTSPLIKTEDIEGIVSFARAQEASCVVSLCESNKHPYWMYQLDESRKMLPFFQTQFSATRQELPPAFVLNGALYWAKTMWFEKKRSFFTENTLGYVMPPERSVDIDTLLDWEWVELLIKRSLF